MIHTGDTAQRIRKHGLDRRKRNIIGLQQTQPFIGECDTEIARDKNLRSRIKNGYTIFRRGESHGLHVTSQWSRGTNRPGAPAHEQTPGEHAADAGDKMAFLQFLFTGGETAYVPRK